MITPERNGKDSIDVLRALASTMIMLHFSASCRTLCGTSPAGIVSTPCPSQRGSFIINQGVDGALKGKGTQLFEKRQV